MSYMSVDGTRSEAQHAGVPAVATTTFKYGVGPKGVAVVVAASGIASAGRTIKLLSYTVSPSGTAAASFDFGSSGSGTTATAHSSSLTGNITKTATESFHQQIGHPIAGIGYCTVGENLVVSGTVAGGDGTVTYSLVP